MKSTMASLMLAIASCGLAIAQDAPSPPEGPNPQMGPRAIAIQAVRTGDRGPVWISRSTVKWWKDSELMRKIGVSDEQVQRIEKIFQGHRLDLIDLHAALEKQEAILDPLIEADQPDESQVIAQIDKVAQARANLEKSNAQMLLAIRRVLTVDQWKKLRDQPGISLAPTGPRFEPPALPPGEGNVMYFTPPARLP